jgi:DNA-binding CsgD family transcriptional regulator
MAPRHERFSAVLAFWHRASLRALIGLTRSENDRDFSPAERRTLLWLHRHIGEALDRVRKLHRERSAHGVLKAVLARLPLPLVALDWDLDVLYHNRAANESAALWIHGQTSARCLKPMRCFEIPPDIAALCTVHKAAWSRFGKRTGNSAKTTNVVIAHPSLPGFRGSVRLMHLDPAGLGMPVFIVLFEHAPGRVTNLPPAGKRELSQIARLSVREREVAALVCRGESNKEIAAHLGKSVLTVKTQLQSVYKKLRQVGRGRLISLLMEQ